MFVRTFSLKASVAATLLALAAGAFAMKPVTVVEQGSFAAGGTVVEAKTAYDPYHPKAEARRCTVITPSSRIRCPNTAVNSVS